MAIKLGIMGFGNIGRKIYSETLNMDNIEVSAICDIGDPEILKYLLKTEFDNMDGVELDRVRAYRIKYYADLVTRKPDLEKFYYGWFRRGLEV